MRSIIIAAALLSATALPSLAMAQQSCEEHRNNRVVGTVAGAGIGGVLGNVIAGGGDKTLGTILGAVGGGVVGNQVSRGNGNCASAYGYYDKSGRWNASDVAANLQTGYYDRDSNWVEGAPRGYYDNQNRWVAAQGNPTSIGYRDSNGRWVAPAANEFDGNNRYSVGMVNGYWQNGRWIAGDTSGSYDSNGRWQQGQAGGRRDGNGNWVGDAQPGYYDSRGGWHAGSVRGQYDSRGVFVAENVSGNGNGNGNRNRNGNGMVNGYWQNGRWIAGDTSGSYDQYGRWQQGQVGGHRDANGNWVADAQPGYYDARGRWNAGAVRGHYDARGVFVAENGNGNGYGNAGYGDGQRDIQSRFTRIWDRIDRGVRDGSISRNEAQRATDELKSIRRYDRSVRTRDGSISVRNETTVQARLDRLNDSLRAMRNNG